MYGAPKAAIHPELGMQLSAEQQEHPHIRPIMRRNAASKPRHASRTTPPEPITGDETPWITKFGLDEQTHTFGTGTIFQRLIWEERSSQSGDSFNPVRGEGSICCGSGWLDIRRDQFVKYLRSYLVPCTLNLLLRALRFPAILSTK